MTVLYLPRQHELFTNHKKQNVDVDYPGKTQVPVSAALGELLGCHAALQPTT